MREGPRVPCLHRLALAAFALSAVSAAVVASGWWTTTNAGAAATTAQFCRDTAELQGWIAQRFEPGIDQYTTHPNASYVNTLAQYLHKLAGEAPPAARADLSTWARFTANVADGASQHVLDADVAAARAAARRVTVWLDKESGCPRDYTTTALPAAHTSSHKVLYWVAGGVAGIIVLTLLAAVARPGSARAARPASTSGSTIGNNSPQRCGACNGAGSTTCGACQGRGVIDANTPAANAPYADSTAGCSRCGRSGKIRCTMCGGSGTRR